MLRFYFLFHTFYKVIEELRFMSMSPEVLKNTAQSSDISCPICNGTQLNFIFNIDNKFPVKECIDCKFQTITPQPTDQDLAAIYSEHYYLLERSEEGLRNFCYLKESTANHYLDLIQRYIETECANKTLLEIGCGEGDFIKVAADRGYKVCAVEYNKNAVTVAQQKVGARGTVICGEIKDLNTQEGQFDICVLSDVIEHVRDPRNFLLTVRKFLKPEGVLFVACPSLESWSAKLQGHNWVEYKPEHIHYFTPGTLIRLMTDCGFSSFSQKAGIKTLSIDYITRHFEKFPVPYFTKLSKWTTPLLPNSLKLMPIKLVASGMIVMGRKCSMPGQ